MRAAPNAGVGVSAAAAATGVAVLLAGRGSAAAPEVAHSVIRVSGAYTPEQTTDEAAVYLTVTDAGDAPDRLLHATSDVSAMVGLHRTAVSGTVEQMTDLASLPVPAHGTVRLAVGGTHLMLMPSRALRRGDRVTLTLTFAAAGPVRVVVPVTGLTGPGS